ncbi:hypothetical protein Zmor_007576 [Zophobas morio]|uniref:Uncharacterized protein n=1 Tax=Zophobas morio TaxID=2755281 RepID=A0AA38IWX1_9CUCU|nr:hypothetical protein Zmor_007576 [Zophobas morio]
MDALRVTVLRLRSITLEFRRGYIERKHRGISNKPDSRFNFGFFPRILHAGIDRVSFRGMGAGAIKRGRREEEAKGWGKGIPGLGAVCGAAPLFR